MSAPAISFSCHACQKKFSTPASLAGKSVKCSCGTQLTIPMPSASAGVPAASASAASYASVNAASSQPTSGYSAPAQVTQPASYSHSANAVGRGGNPSSRREFPALKFVANVIEFISWLYLIGGVLGAISIVVLGSQGPPDSLAVAVFTAIVVVVCTLLLVVFIRASAELVRLGMYVAELLEDIRSNTV